MEQHFTDKYGIMGPTVVGVNEALERLRNSDKGEWGSSVDLEGDFSDLYSNVDLETLKKYVKMGSDMAGISKSSQAYILNLLEVNSRHSYFREPNGIFHSDKGYSMGDHSAGRGSEVSLKGSEIESFEKLDRKNYIPSIPFYNRFRDDIGTHITNMSIDIILDIIWIISQNYPKNIQLNLETNIISGKFLNVRHYNVPGKTSPYTTVLRKRNTKYEIIPPTSNTNPIYKKCAGTTYFNMARSHCSDIRELERQILTVKTILRQKGFSENQIKRMQKHKQKRMDYTKLYTGTVEFDHVSRIHKYVRNIFRLPLLEREDYGLPMVVTGKKLHQFIFTVRKMRKILNF